MRARCGLLVTTLLILAAAPLSAQGRTVRGTVSDSGSRTPIAGANVVVRGTTIGASTGSDGRFTLAVPAGGDTVLVRRFRYRYRQVVIVAVTTALHGAVSST